MLGPRGFCRTVEQFRQYDRRDAKAVGFSIEAIAQTRRTISENTNAEIGIKQIAEHQKLSRACAGG
jgi:hypothetical protein